MSELNKCLASEMIATTILLTEPNAQEDIETKGSLGKFVEPFSKIASLERDCGGNKIQDKVDHEGILEKRKVHCGQLAGRTVIPIDTDVGETEKEREMSSVGE